MTHSLPVDQRTRELLDRYGFDEATFAKLRERLRAGEAGPEHNRIRGHVEPPEPGDVTPLPPLGSDARDMLAKRGEEAIRNGEVGAVVLAGGMATRFGGVVKAVVEAIPGQSFLDLKVRDAQRLAEAAGGLLPLYLMTSFATDSTLREVAEGLRSERVRVEPFPQLISLRLTPQGDIFHDASGKPSPYAPGHGDLTFALRRTGVLQRFREAGGKVLYMSNVDNATATLDPAVIGAHLEWGAAVTAEVAPKEEGDKGGAPARVDGRAQIVEAFRFPADFDQSTIPVFNTNSFVLDAEAIDRDFPLTWFAVTKKVDGHEVIQFEHLVGELTAFLPSRFLRVERHGPDARFQPVKDPEELQSRRPEIEQALRARGVL
ncbi:MAG: UTP--glucose-1-phosphate uridylyltransferase [Myxococcota bacterium]